MAARLLRVPIAIVSVVDEDRIWFRSHHGIEATDIPRSPRQIVERVAAAVLDGRHQRDDVAILALQANRH